MHKTRQIISVAIAASLSLFSTSVVFAQDEEGETAQSDEQIEVIITTGTRRLDRTSADSMSPIDVIGSEEITRQAGTEIDDILRTSVPSYQVGSHPIDDASTLVRPAKLRSLAPDQALVLVNGIRRHRSAVIAFVTDALTPGAQGPDLSVIPGSALKHVEVLRDGASAIYGSDAIAGVLNFHLKDDNDGGSFVVRSGESFEGDGGMVRASGNIGLPLGDTGFVNLTAEYFDQDESIRTTQRNDVSWLIEKRQAVGRSTDGLGPDTQIWGQPFIRDSVNLWFNSGYELDNGVELFSFGNYSEREVEGGFFFRNPDTRNGVFARGGIRLVGAITPEAYDTNACEKYRLPPSGPGSSEAAIAADFANLDAIAADPACFSFNELFPNGFTPRFGGNIEDFSMAFGVRGDATENLHFDVKYYRGENLQQFFIFNTVNAARGPEQPAGYYHRPGDYRQEENSVHADFLLETNPTFLNAPLYIGFGGEWRREAFEVVAGDFHSWVHSDPSQRTQIENLLLLQGFTPASNGFSGFTPSQEGIWTRDNSSVYVDLESDLTDRWTLGVAARYENYDDFGATTEHRIAASYDVSNRTSLRATMSTGFRAPTPGQSNVRNVSTIFELSLMDLVEVGLVPPTDPVAALKGGLPLAPERSNNVTIGVNVDTGDRVLTVDAFFIKVYDRITNSAQFQLTQEEVTLLLNQGLAGVNAGSQVRYYTNGWETNTRGLEIVSSGDFNIGLPGSTDLTIAATVMDNQVTGRDPTLVDDQRTYNLQHLLPQTRITATLNHYWNDLRFMTRISYWGAWSILELGANWPDEYAASTLLDAEVSYALPQTGIDVVLGVSNITDNYPEEYPYGATSSGQLYHEYSPYGFLGGFAYGQISYSFD